MIKDKIKARFRGKLDRGAVAVEYALIIGLIAVALVGALLAFSPKLGSFVDEFSFTGAETDGGGNGGGACEPGYDNLLPWDYGYTEAQWNAMGFNWWHTGNPEEFSMEGTGVMLNGEPYMYQGEQARGTQRGWPGCPWD